MEERTVTQRLKGEGMEAAKSHIFRALNSILLSLRYDEESDGIYGIDQGGFLFTRREFEELTDGMTKFFEHYGDGGVAEYNAEVENRMHSHEPNDEENYRKPRKGWVYVVEGQNNQYKIGLTTRTPSKRLAEFTPKLPFETTLLLTIPSDDVYSLEGKIHARFDPQRVNGEWFELSERDILWLRAGAR